MAGVEQCLRSEEVTGERKWFGTDGVRGRVGRAPMTPDFVLRLGWALGTVLASNGPSRHPKVVIGKDTRLSGYMLEAALEAGLSAAGARSYMLGVIPTPAVSLLTTTFRAAAGIVVSASHNPFHDNGIKIFGANGYKLADKQEREIEALLEQELQCAPEDGFGKAVRIDDARGRYIEFCKYTFKAESLKGLKIVLDCANGASYYVAPRILEELGAELVVIGDEPNGLNINDGVGSTKPAALQTAVREHQADLGIALDGDADRCLLVNSAGELVDGDAILYVLACARSLRGELNGPVVGTKMSNFGLELALKSQGVGLERADVGDRYVFERMQQCGVQLGGEPSGHILVLDRSRTGDGLVAALQVLAEMRNSERSLDDLISGLTLLPQVLINVRVDGARPREILAHPQVKQSAEDAEQKLNGHGRLLLRASGTEPLIRVMTEADDDGLAHQCAQSVADAVAGIAAP